MAFQYGDYGFSGEDPMKVEERRRLFDEEQRRGGAAASRATDVPSFMRSPAVQRMQQAQQAGGTGRFTPPGGGGLGGLPMLQLLAPYLSQRGGAAMGAQQGGMSPLLQQLLPMLLAQQRMRGRMPPTP